MREKKARNRREKEVDILGLKFEIGRIERKAQHHWAFWKVLRKQASDLEAEIKQLEEELNNEP